MSIKRAFLTLLAVLLLPGLAWAQEGTRATFLVNKDFTDDNTAGVEVSISCNTGLPLDQTKTIYETPVYVEFVVVDFDSGSMNCTVTETPVAGYAATYSADAGAFVATPCEFTAIETGAEFTCDVQNDAIPVDVVITKEWIINSENPEDVDVDGRYDITLTCDAPITGGYASGDDYVIHSNGNFGDDIFTFEVQPSIGGNSCSASETTYDSAVESDSSDCQSLSIGIGSGASCTITNTVFFEGIPTLSQYSMAIMALLMLGVGFVGFRRFV